jgi:hypothetical protein
MDFYFLLIFADFFKTIARLLMTSARRSAAYA